MATGRFAFGMCGRCGMKVPYLSLRRDGYNGGLYVCEECYDLPEERDTPVHDDVNLKHPQPDPGTDRETATLLATAMGFDTYFGGGT